MIEGLGAAKAAPKGIVLTHLQWKQADLVQRHVAAAAPFLYPNLLGPGASLSCNQLLQVADGVVLTAQTLNMPSQHDAAQHEDNGGNGAQRTACNTLRFQGSMTCFCATLNSAGDADTAEMCVLVRCAACIRGGCGCGEGADIALALDPDLLAEAVVEDNLNHGPPQLPQRWELLHTHRLKRGEIETLYGRSTVVGLG